MSIKNVKPNKRYNHGKYIPKNPEKYVGKYPIVWRSSWERKYCMYCDKTPEIIKWSSEPFSIKYFNPATNKTHKYWPDYWILLEKDGVQKQYLVEIKPKKKLIKPKVPKRKTAKSSKNYAYAVNEYIQILSKSKAAKIFAKKNNMEYIILTEDTIR